MRRILAALLLSIFTSSGGGAMGLVNIEVAHDRSFAINLMPANEATFVVTTITVVDESLSPVWMIVADNVAITAALEEAQDDGARKVEIRGSETLLTEQRSTPPKASSVGRHVRTIRFGHVPSGFLQLVPHNNNHAVAENGKTYHVFVNGSESGTAEVRM
jgi:hypothetical protein